MAATIPERRDVTVTDETADKFRLIQETLADIIHVTKIDDPQWTALIEAGLTIADTCKKKYPDVSMAFYETICQACPDFEAAYDYQNKFYTRAFWSKAYLQHTGE